MVKKDENMENEHDMTNHDGLLNKTLPDTLEESLQQCLQIKPVVFLNEEEVR